MRGRMRERSEQAEPTVGELLGLTHATAGSYMAKYVLNEPVDIMHNSMQRQLYRVLQEHGPDRSRVEIDEKIRELIATGDTREESIAIDVLRWASDENVEWVLDEYIEEGDGTELDEYMEAEG